MLDSLVLSVGQRLCIDFSVSKANFLTTLRSHLDVTYSCHFIFKLFNVDVNYIFIIYLFIVNYSCSPNWKNLDNYSYFGNC